MKIPISESHYSEGKPYERHVDDLGGLAKNHQRDLYQFYDLRLCFLYSEQKDLK